MGQHRLLPGKETAFDSDIRVPLIVAGPGVPPAQAVPELVQNTDLYPTFVQLVGRDPGPGMDGHNLLPLLHPSLAATPLIWPSAALIEHHGPTDTGDPDFENGLLGGNPPSYESVRLSNRQFGDSLYVEYTRTGEREFYDISSDPFERNNIYWSLSQPKRAELHRILLGLERCHNPTACWTARDPQARS
jgi:N-acetylglucosamine-6-sulfatase